MVKFLNNNPDNEYLLQNDAQRFETWEQNIAAKIGFGVAIQYALDLGIDAIWQRIQYLAQKLRHSLLNICGVTLQDLGNHKCGIITFSCKNKSPEEIQRYLASMKINVSISLQEYARLDMVKRNIPALIRASVHYYNTEEEIDVFCTAVKKMLGS